MANVFNIDSNRNIINWCLYFNEFTNEKDFNKFKKTKFKIIRVQEQFNQVTVRIEKDSTQSLFEELENYDVKFFSEVKYTLEKHFTKIIMEENKNDEYTFIKTIM